MSTNIVLDRWVDLNGWNRAGDALGTQGYGSIYQGSLFVDNNLTPNFNPIYVSDVVVDNNFLVECSISPSDDQSIYFYKKTNDFDISQIGFFNALSFTYFQMIFDETGSWWPGGVDSNGNVLSGRDIIFAVRKPGFPPECDYSLNGSVVKDRFNLYRIGTYEFGSIYRILFGKKEDGTCYGLVYDMTRGTSREVFVGSMESPCEIPYSTNISLAIGIGGSASSSEWAGRYYSRPKILSGISDEYIDEAIIKGDLSNTTSNINITKTSEEYQDRYSYYTEPTSNNGLQMYLDLESITPEHIKRRPDMMEIIYMFQDYLNNAYKKIPYYEKTISYTHKDTCSEIATKKITQRVEPYNHTISMTIEKENNSMQLDDLKIFEEYDANRDITTYITEPEVLENYIQKYQYDYIGSYYYSRVKYYKSLNEFIKINFEKNIDTPFEIFISTIDSYKDNNSDLNTQFITISEALSKFSNYSGDFEINMYYCGYSEFLETFDYVGEFDIESSFYPTFESNVDNYNEDEDFVDFAGHYSSKNSALSSIDFNANRFRVKITDSGSISTILNNISTIDAAISIKLKFDNMQSLVSKSILGDYPILAPEFTIIKRWQDPKTFYEEFSHENQYRIDSKNSSILEKINRIAFNKDPSVIDFEYIQFVAEQMGYNINVEQEDIENNEYYTTKEDKENALRAIIRNLPEFYKIKCTKNGLEALLLSFGIVGEIIYLYTIGDETQAGYADFIDARYIEGSEDDMMPDDTLAQELMTSRLNNPSLASTVTSDWFPSPHFKVELDLLKQNLSLDANKLGLSILNKAVKKTKPINTVFRGFYGHMMNNFGYIFLHKPKLHMTAYARTNISDSCVQVDIWDARCNL